MDHVTEGGALPPTLLDVEAVNCCAPEGPNETCAGLTLKVVGGGGGVKLTLALAVLVESAELVAIIVTVCAEVIVDGAVYTPLFKVPTLGLIDHVAAVLVEPVTVDANVAVWLGPNAVALGVTEIDMVDGGGGGGGGGGAVPAGGSRVMMAVAFLFELDALIPVSVTVICELM